MLIGHIFLLLHMFRILLDTGEYVYYIAECILFLSFSFNFLRTGIHLLTDILILLRPLFKVCYGGYKLPFTLKLTYPYFKGIAFVGPL